MGDILGISVSANMFFYIMVSIGFFVGIILMVAPEAFDSLHKSLQREYGLKIRLVPKIENTSVDVIDRAIIKNRVMSGLIISVAAFVLLLLYK